MRKLKDPHSRQAQGQRGSVIMMSLVGLFVVTLIGSYMATAYSGARAAQERANFVNLIAQIELDIQNAVNSEPSWQATINDHTHNPSMNCLVNNTCSSSINATPFILWPAGTLTYGDTTSAIYDGSQAGIAAGKGYNFNGTPCSSFSKSPNPGNPECPIQVSLTWATPGCSPTPCTAPVNVVVGILFNPGAGSVIGSINTQNFTIPFTRTPTGGNQGCAGQPSASEIQTCMNPTNIANGDQLYCVGVFPYWKCGRVFK